MGSTAGSSLSGGAGGRSTLTGGSVTRGSLSGGAGGRSTLTGGKNSFTGGKIISTKAKFVPKPSGNTDVIASLRAQLKREQQRKGEEILGDGDDDEGAMYVMGGRGKSIKTKQKQTSPHSSYRSPQNNPNNPNLSLTVTLTQR